MHLLDELTREHETIDRVLGSLRTWSDLLAKGDAPLADRDAFVRFFTSYAGSFHHDREELILIPALSSIADLPSDRGPIAVLLTDHQRMGATLGRLAAESDPARLRLLAKEYSHALWAHIDIENYIFFPTSEDRLRSSGVTELPSRAITDEESEALSLGETLLVRYPPMQPDLIRGDGCVMCQAYGDTCRGLELEWWNDWEWEEFSDRIAAS